MKVKRFIFCLLLSVALSVTFIPVTAYAAEDDPHDVYFYGVDSFTDDNDGSYYAVLDHATVWVNEDYYDSANDCLCGAEGSKIWFELNNFNEDWDIDGIYWESEDENVYGYADYDYSDDLYFIELPIEEEDYGDITVYVDFYYDDDDEDEIDPRYEDIDECGTIVIDGDWHQVESEGLTWEGPHGALAEMYGSFTGFDEDIYPHALIGDRVAVEFFPPLGQSVAEVTLNGEPLEGVLDEEDGENDIYRYTVSADEVNGATRTPGNILAVTFEDDYGFEELTPETMATAQSFILNQETSVGRDCLFAFTPDVDDVYVFYSKNMNTAAGATAAGRVSAPDGTPIAVSESQDDEGFWIYFSAEAGKTYYLQGKSSISGSSFDVGIQKSDVESIEYTPAGKALQAEKPCSSDEDYYINSTIHQVGDRLTINYKSEPPKEYVCKEFPADDESYLSFVDDNNNELQTILELEPDYSGFDASNEVGSTTTLTVTAKYAEEEYEFTVDVKFVYAHNMQAHPAVEATCQTAGNTAYWQCTDCDKYFSDEAGQKEIASESWVVKNGGHKWQPGSTPAGLLQNGSQYDQCAVCGAIANIVDVPGWASYYVKGLKVAKGKGSLTVKWKKQGKKNLKKFNGYQIRYATKSDMSDAKYKTAGKKAASKKIGKLKKKTKYFVQVRTYTKTGAGTFYSKWSGKKTVKTK